MCNVYVAFFPKNSSDEYIRSDGLHVEIGWASSLKKPIILIGDNLPCKENSHITRGLKAITYVQFLDMKKVVQNPNILDIEIRNAIKTSYKIP